MNDEKPPLITGGGCAGCGSAFLLALFGLMFGLLWLGVMMGEPAPGVHANRSMAFVYLPAAFACWGVALMIFTKAMTKK